MTDPIVPISRHIFDAPIEPVARVHRQTEDEREQERERRRHELEEEAAEEREAHASPPDDEGHQHIDVRA